MSGTDMPPAWRFETALTVRVSDVNYGGHLGNDRVLTLFHEIRVRWLAVEGWTELDLGGVGIIQTEATVRYRAQAQLGERLIGRLRVNEARSRGFSLGYGLWSESHGREVASGTTAFLFFDYSSQGLTRGPESVVRRLARR